MVCPCVYICVYVYITQQACHLCCCPVVKPQVQFKVALKRPFVSWESGRDLQEAFLEGAQKEALSPLCAEDVPRALPRPPPVLASALQGWVPILGAPCHAHLTQVCVPV